jgi:hypothetical protein
VTGRWIGFADSALVTYELIVLTRVRWSLFDNV